MTAERISFEIQSLRSGRWISSSVISKEDEALAIAQRQFNDRKCEGVKVLRLWARADGETDETQIFLRTRNVEDEDEITVAKIDHAPALCETPEAYYDTNSRQVINRLFRSYLDQATLTATELIHDNREIKRLNDKGGLVNKAVDRVSTLQARTYNVDQKRRRDELFKATEDMGLRARATEKLSLPTITATLSEAMGKLPDGSTDKTFLANVVLSKDLLSNRSWPGKLDRVCKLAIAETDPAALELLDAVMADILASNVVQDILGWQPNLGQAIISLFNLADGNLPETPTDAVESVVLLDQLFADGKLPLGRACLVDRAHRLISSANPLNRIDPTKEQETYRLLIERLLLPTGFHSGAVTALALTKRYSHQLDKGGAAGWKASISGTCRLMPDKVASLIYLCEMLKLPETADHADVVNERFEDILFVRHISDLCAKGLTGRDRLARATWGYNVVASSSLSNPLKSKVTERIDAIIDRYLVDEQIIEKMNDPSVPLRDRAIRLVQFCASGVLPTTGKAIARAKERVVELLKQPNFEAHLTEGLTDGAAIQDLLRNFYQLLVKAGLKS